MNIPAFDAVMSSRFGIVQSGESVALTQMYDVGVEGCTLSSEIYRRPKTIITQTALDGIVTEKFFSSPDSRHNLSDEMWNELARIYNAEGETEIHYNKVREYERDLLSAIVAHLNVEEIPLVLSRVIKEAGRRDERPDIELVDNENRSFEDSDFSTYRYIPREDYIEDDCLRFIDGEYDNRKFVALWYQFETSDDKIEIPLVSMTSHSPIIQSHNPGYGNSEWGQNLSPEFEEALRYVLRGDVPDIQLGYDEKTVVDIVQNYDLDGTQTESAIRRCL